MKPSVDIKDRDPEIEKVRLALTMSGVSIDYQTTGLVLQIIKGFQEKGGEFSIRDSAKITAAHHQKWSEYFENRKGDPYSEIVSMEKKVLEIKRMLDKEKLKHPILSRSIMDLDFSTRVIFALKKLNVNTLGELLEKTETDLMNTRNVGKKTLVEIKDFLNQYNLKLAGA